MTATAGLHNMPADLRPAIVADDGHVFVRADLGRSNRESWLPCPATRRWRAPPTTPTCTPRSPVVSTYRATSPRWPSSVRCTARRPATVRPRCAVWNSPIPWRWGSSPLRPRAAEGGNDLRTRGGRLVADERSSRTRLGRVDATIPRRGARAVRTQRDDPGCGGGVLQDVGSHRPRPGRTARRIGRVVPARRTPRARAPAQSSAVAGGRRRRVAGGRPSLARGGARRPRSGS